MFRQKCREETRDAETQKKQGDEQNSSDLATYIGNGACSPDDALDFLDLGKTISTIACTLWIESREKRNERQLFPLCLILWTTRTKIA